MKLLLSKSTLSITATLAVVAVIIPVSVGAQPANANEQRAQAQQMQTSTHERTQAAQEQRMQAQATEQREAGQNRGEEHRQAASGRLEAAKLKACENREKAINNIITRLSNRGAKQLEVFTKISERTQDFYIEQGNTLENYEALVAEVSTKKASAEEAVASSSDNKFSCDGENPKQVANSFKESLHAQNAALREYRTAIKNLIVGVKSAQLTDEVDGTTESSDEAKTEETGE